MRGHLAEITKSLAPVAIPGFILAIGVATILDVRGIFEPT